MMLKLSTTARAAPLARAPRRPVVTMRAVSGDKPGDADKVKRQQDERKPVARSPTEADSAARGSRGGGEAAPPAPQDEDEELPQELGLDEFEEIPTADKLKEEIKNQFKNRF